MIKPMKHHRMMDNSIRVFRYVCLAVIALPVAAHACSVRAFTPGERWFSAAFFRVNVLFVADHQQSDLREISPSGMVFFTRPDGTKGQSKLWKRSGAGNGFLKFGQTRGIIELHGLVANCKECTLDELKIELECIDLG